MKKPPFTLVNSFADTEAEREWQEVKALHEHYDMLHAILAEREFESEQEREVFYDGLRKFVQLNPTQLERVIEFIDKVKKETSEEQKEG